VAEFTEIIDTAKKQKEAFIKLQNALFPDGEIPSAETILERLKTGEHTLRDAIIAKMYEQGTTIAPRLTQDSDTMEFAQKFVNSFDQKTGGKLASSIATEIDSYKSIPLDTKFSDAILVTKPNQKNQQVRIVKKELDTSIAGILGNEQKFLGTRAVKGSKKLVKGLLPEGILDDVLAGVAKIEDPVLKDAVLASLLGYRGEALTQSFATRELAVTQLEKPRPYYVPETGTFVNPPVPDKKGYGPDKPLGPLFKSIMDRRYAEAMQGSTGQLFPGMTTAKISKALKDTVFANIRPEILDKLDRKPDGYTDMRRIVASEVANRLGDEKSAAAIIGHAKGKGDIDISVMTGYYADVVDEAEALARKDIYFAFEGAMSKALGGSSLQDLAGSLNLPLPDTAKDVVYPDFKQGDVSAGFAQQEIDLSPEEIEKRKKINLATMQDTLRGKEVSAAKKTKEKVELYKDISEEDIVKTGEKEALFEQTKKTTAANLKQDQRTKKTEEISKSWKDRIGSILDNKGVQKSLIVGAGSVPVLSTLFTGKEASAYIQEKTGIPPEIATPLGYGLEAASPVAPTDIKMAEEVGEAVAKPVATAASQFESGFMDRIRSQLSQLQN